MANCGEGFKSNRGILNEFKILQRNTEPACPPAAGKSAGGLDSGSQTQFNKMLNHHAFGR